ncbi:RNase H domain-containing protein [Trichonephila clavipes]|nr:RNase H domain-containing protein [Trichonephila clavipes]
MVSFNLTIGAVEPNYLSQCLDPADDLDRVFFHPELPVHVNKQADLPAYLKQLALERIGDIPIDAIQVFTDVSRDDNYRSGSGIYIKSQDHILRIQRRNPDGCSVFRSELIAIDEALVLFQMEKRFGFCLLVEVQYKVAKYLEGNEIADTLAKAGARELPEPSAPLTFLEIFSRTKHQNKTAWITPPYHHWYQCSRPGGSLAHGFTRHDQTLLTCFRSGHIKSMKFSEGRKSFEMCTNCSSEPATSAHILECLGLTKQDLADVPLLVLDYLKVCHGPGLALLTNGGVQQQRMLFTMRITLHLEANSFKIT